MWFSSESNIHGIINDNIIENQSNPVHCEIVCPFRVACRRQPCRFRKQSNKSFQVSKNDFRQLLNLVGRVFSYENGDFNWSDSLIWLMWILFFPRSEVFSLLGLRSRCLWDFSYQFFSTVFAPFRFFFGVCIQKVCVRQLDTLPHPFLFHAQQHARRCSSNQIDTRNSFH